MTSYYLNYFLYLPPTPEKALWGYEIRGCGRAAIHPNETYPPKGHPEDHHFDWKKGRALESLQVVFLSSGSGTLETATARKQKIIAGSAFLLFPGEWHRYRPHPATGWVENWVEIDGQCVRGLLESGALSPKSPVLSPSSCGEIDKTFRDLHQHLATDGVPNTAELSLLAHRMMNACISAPNKSGTDSRIEEIVRTAERHLAEKCGEVIDLPKLAAGWGIGYTTFRRAFALRTGVSPWQYVLQARMNRVRRALADTDATLDEIAATTGFGSGYHLANFFKKAHSMPPGTWRKSARKKSRISK